MTENPFDDAALFFEPEIDLGLLLPVERREPYSKPPFPWPTAMRWVAAGVLAASTVVFFGGGALATEVRAAMPGARLPSTVGLSEARRCLEDLKGAPGLPGIEAPNAAAFEGAERILKALEAEGGPIPERLVPDASGGISLLFFAGQPLPGGARPKYAALTATNEGEISALTHDRVAGLTETWSAQGGTALRAAFRRLQGFLTL